MRIGKSTDIHRLEKNRKLVLGGVTIPSDLGSVAHSDGDVLLHTIGEALLGALALGDLGKFYPDDDPTYKNISSVILVKDIFKKIRDCGYKVQNIDSTVFLEKPKLRKYIDEIRENIANMLEIDMNSVSVKATTGEKIGIVGKREAIIADTILLLVKI